MYFVEKAAVYVEPEQQIYQSPARISGLDFGVLFISFPVPRPGCSEIVTKLVVNVVNKQDIILFFL